MQSQVYMHAAVSLTPQSKCIYDSGKRTPTSMHGGKQNKCTGRTDTQRHKCVPSCDVSSLLEACEAEHDCSSNQSPVPPIRKPETLNPSPKKLIKPTSSKHRSPSWQRPVARSRNQTHPCATRVCGIYVYVGRSGLKDYP